MSDRLPVVVITGAAGGIGAAVRSRLDADGWTVVPTDIVAGEGIINCDISDTRMVDLVVARAAKDHGGIDALVNAAGIGRPSAFLDADDAVWQRHIDINLMGTVRMCRAVLPHLVRSTHSARGIVNFTSQAAKTGGLLIGAPYSAAKAAVLCLTMTLAAEFGPHGVRVNGVAPGIIETSFLDGVPGIREKAGQLPLRRLGVPDDVAGVVAFLLSPDAAYLTGEVVDVNGGLLMD